MDLSVQTSVSQPWGCDPTYGRLGLKCMNCLVIHKNIY